ncbi:MAG TPA: ATP-binding protein [Gemmata sp.]|jgi:signal transduction histidine kinase|nr:ATP-binding protein [Gemmata sp.]
MTAAAPIEDLLHQVLDRLTRQERRTESIEATLLRLAPPAGSVRSPHGLHQTKSTSSSETPPEIPWPRRDVRDSAKSADRVRELETRLSEAEERLRVAARLEIVGRLVAGVAHDFNNLLTIISGHADVIRSELPNEHSLRDTAELISNTAHTAAGLTRQLVSFGKPGRPDPCPVDANASVRAIEGTLGRLTGGRVALNVTLATSIPLIRIDPGQFDQVLMNLVVNARDAIRDTGTITIRTASATITPGRAGWPLDIQQGEFVVVTVTDTGIGMTEEVKARIFDLFFTTKGARGNGVGLSTVKDIVKATRGHIEVESSPDWGTSVRVFWPVYPEPTPGPRLAW